MARGAGKGEPDAGRRALLRGRAAPPPEPLRPPWAAAGFAEACSGCGACLAACPEAILVRGAGGLAEVDFRRGECSFCGACAEACPEPAFERGRATPWTLLPEIGEACLAAAGVVCQSCGDACPEAAIRFRPRLGAAPLPEIEPAACSGCGACLSACPVEAVAIVRAAEPADA